MHALVSNLIKIKAKVKSRQWKTLLILPYYYIMDKLCFLSSGNFRY